MARFDNYPKRGPGTVRLSRRIREGSVLGEPGGIRTRDALIKSYGVWGTNGRGGEMVRLDTLIRPDTLTCRALGLNRRERMREVKTYDAQTRSPNTALST